MVEEKDLDTIRACIDVHQIEIWEIAAIEKDLNPKRDRYC